LKRQVRKHVPDPETIEERHGAFLEAVNAAYHESDAERAMLERALELDSREHLQANENLRRSLSLLEKSERELKESESRFRQMAETVRSVFWVSDPSGAVLYISPGYETIWGRSCQSLYEDPESYLEAVHPDDRARVESGQSKRARGEETEEVYRIVRPDRSIRWIRERGFPIRDDAGRVHRSTGEAEDITEGKRLQDELRQSQKMEAVGRLAGGIAHDFNNLLTVILGYGGTLADRVKDNPRATRDITEIRKAANRAASLTRQLLAFSRKQVLHPTMLDLNDVVGDMEDMLRRLIGEDILLETGLAPTLASVKADRGQLEQVIMNLAVNSRDAMSEGGRLIIETREVDWDATGALAHAAAPGRYVLLSVTDTGCGMDPETRSHLFEPFFTTKDPGKGTGLGLATVYGIVTQSGGHIAVQSERGQGTSFRIYLPRMDGNRAAKAPDALLPGQVRRGSETILLVEDDRAVLDLTREILEDVGYRVITAGDGEQALALFRDQPAGIDVLVTDVVMPGLSGLALTRAIRAIRPELSVICMSGHTEHVILEDGLLETVSAFIQKPFTPDSFARTVRDVLDGSARAVPGS
jgi:PAS domain S-box-containing protein